MHQPCLAGLTGRPDGEKMAGFTGFTDNGMEAVFHQSASRDAKMDILINRPVGMESAHGVLLYGVALL